MHSSNSVYISHCSCTDFLSVDVDISPPNHRPLSQKYPQPTSRSFDFIAKFPALFISIGTKFVPQMCLFPYYCVFYRVLSTSFFQNNMALSIVRIVLAVCIVQLALATTQQDFVGTWKLTDSENFDAYLEKLGKSVYFKNSIIRITFV